MSTARRRDRRPPSPRTGRGERFYQRLLDEETREVPVSLRATSAGHLDPAGIVASRYFDPEFHRREVEQVWGRTWQMACREEQIPQVGDSIVYEIADWSLIVVRTASDEIRAFHNSCLHRGTQLRTRPGRVTGFRCPYHGFTWNLDGTLREIPCAWDFPQVDQAIFCLPQAQVGTWGGFVFVNVDDQAAPSRSTSRTSRGTSRRPLEERYLRPHRADDAVQLEGGARGVHRGVPHDGGAPAAPPHRRLTR